MESRLVMCTLVLAAFCFSGCADEIEPTNNSPSNNHGGGDADVADVGDVDQADVDLDTGVDTGDGGEEPGADADADSGDSEEPDADAGDAGGQECGAQASEDCDYDGLLDCEEVQMGTALCDHDTDDDGVTDFQEVQHGTDPLGADSDADGLDDATEIDLGLNPNNQDTFADGTIDSDRWLANACEGQQSEDVRYFTSSVHAGDWRVGLPSTFRNYQELSIATATPQNYQAAATYWEPSLEIAGSILSATAGGQTPIEIRQPYRSKIAQHGTIVQDTNGAVFSTHDYYEAATTSYLVRLHQPRSVRAFRNDLLFDLAEFSAADVSTSLDASGAAYSDMRVFLTVVHRGDRALTLAAFAPADKFETTNRIKFRMDDVVNTTNITTALSEEYEACRSFFPDVEAPKVDFYWMLDPSVTMDDKMTYMLQTAVEFYNQLDQTQLDYRMAVANTSEDLQGRIRPSTGWFTDLNTLQSEVQDYAIDCIPCTGTYRSQEWGLVNTQKAIEYMGSTSAPADVRLRNDALFVPIIMTDEEEQSIQNDPLATATGQAILDGWNDFFTGRAVIYSIVANPGACGAQDGRAYKEVALATGGAYYDICSPDIEETIRDIILRTTSLTGRLQLADTPVSSSLRVFKDGTWVPRSRTNGFDYFADSNSISFFGDFRPSGDDQNPNDFLAISYERLRPADKPPAQ